MKTFLAALALLVILGIAGFLYRNTYTHPGTPPTTGGGCTLEAKICPDGTTVGRTGPDCAFAECTYPNVTVGDLGVSFAIPTGYSANPAAIGRTDNLVAAYERTSATTTGNPDAIVVYDFPIPAGQTASAVLLANTHLEPSDMNPKDMSAFKPKIIGTRTFSAIVIERFEAVVHSAYYLPRAHDVLRFDVLEHDVPNWSDSHLIPDNLPQHRALIQMLGTLEVATQ